MGREIKHGYRYLIAEDPHLIYSSEANVSCGCGSAGKVLA